MHFNLTSGMELEAGRALCLQGKTGVANEVQTLPEFLADCVEAHSWVPVHLIRLIIAPRLVVP